MWSRETAKSVRPVASYPRALARRGVSESSANSREVEGSFREEWAKFERRRTPYALARLESPGRLADRGTAPIMDRGENEMNRRIFLSLVGSGLLAAAFVSGTDAVWSAQAAGGNANEDSGEGRIVVANRGAGTISV